MMLDEHSVELSVTVVDDEPMAQDVLVRAARSWHYHCQAASTAEQALELARKTADADRRHRPAHAGPRRRLAGARDPPPLAAGRRHRPDGRPRRRRRRRVPPGRRPPLLLQADQARRISPRPRNRRAHLPAGAGKPGLPPPSNGPSAGRRTASATPSFPPSTAWSARWRNATPTRPATPCASAATRCAWPTPSAWPPAAQLLSLAAKLHDIGKVGVPEAILNKPAALTDDEYRLVREHPVIGERILSPIIRNPDVLAAIRGHHERLDGGGYPDGLAGRPHPAAGPPHRHPRLFRRPDHLPRLPRRPAAAPALEILEAGAGTHFEPEFVRAFLTTVVPRLSAANHPTAPVQPPSPFARLKVRYDFAAGGSQEGRDDVPGTCRKAVGEPSRRRAGSLRGRDVGGAPVIAKGVGRPVLDDERGLTGDAVGIADEERLVEEPAGCWCMPWNSNTSRRPGWCGTCRW